MKLSKRFIVLLEASILTMNIFCITASSYAQDNKLKVLKGTLLQNTKAAVPSIDSNYYSPSTITFSYRIWYEPKPYYTAKIFTKGDVSRLEVEKWNGKYYDLDTSFILDNFNIDDFNSVFKTICSFDFRHSKSGFLDGDYYQIGYETGGTDINISIHCASGRTSDPSVLKFYTLFSQLEKLTCRSMTGQR